MDCIEEMDKFLEMCKLARLNQKEIEYMNRLITSNKIKSIIKKLLTNRSPGSDGFIGEFYQTFQSVQFSSVAQSLRPHESQHARPPCPSPTPGVHLNSCPLISDAFQPFHPLSSPSPPAPNPSKHQSLFQWVNSSHEVAKVLEFQLYHQSFQWIFRTDFL